MLRLKDNIKEIKARIIKWWVRVPFEVHEKALNTIETMEETIEKLERRNTLLARQNKMLEKELSYAKKRDKIHQDIMIEILPFIDLPAKERAQVKRLNKKLDALIFNS